MGERVSSIPQECSMPLSCMSVCQSDFTITQEWLDVEWWNLAHIHLRSRVIWSSKIGHVHDLWPGQNWRFSYYTFRGHVILHSVHLHVPFPVEYLHVCATGVYLLQAFHPGFRIQGPFVWYVYTLHVWTYEDWVQLS